MKTNEEKLIVKQKLYFEYIKDLKKNPNMSKNRGFKTCNRCGVCCHQQPCDLTLNDIYIIAKHFSLSAKEFFLNKLIIQKYHDNINVITPIKIGQQDIAGTYKPIIRSFDLWTACTFLKTNNECSLGDIKPLGAKLTKCWEDQKFEDIAIVWTNKEIDELLTELDIDLPRINFIKELF